MLIVNEIQLALNSTINVCRFSHARLTRAEMADSAKENKRDGPNEPVGNDKDGEVERSPSDRPNAGHSTIDTKEEEKTEPKKSKLKMFWDGLGLDIGTLMMMFK